MNDFLRRSLLLLVLGVSYAFLFYCAPLGLNVLLFDGLLIGLALRARPELSQYRGFSWSVAGLLFAAGSVVLVHGSASTVAHHLTFLLVLGYAQERELRFVWFGLLLGLRSLLLGHIRWLRDVAGQWRARSGVRTRWPALAWFKQGLVPAFILLAFTGFYLAGNTRFAEGFAKMGNFFLFSWRFWDVIGPLLTTLLGLFLVAAFFFPLASPRKVLEWQAGFQDQLKRRGADEGPNWFKVFNPFRALKNEYRRAVLTFALLNVLLAIVNSTDLRFVWLDSGNLDAATLSHYVHVGTYNLTFSIFLAMGVVVYYFRGSLNFMAGRELLAPLARLWLAQNALLALSVGLRNYHYIDAYGLAMGRVYVGFVLLLILFGLFTLYRKIGRKLSLSYLLHTNGLAAWLFLLAFGAVNWPGVITRYNLAVPGEKAIDWHYLEWSLDDRNTFLLLEQPGVKQQVLRHRWEGTFRQYDWRGWNYPDWRNLRAVEQSRLER